MAQLYSHHSSAAHVNKWLNVSCSCSICVATEASTTPTLATIHRKCVCASRVKLSNMRDLVHIALRLDKGSALWVTCITAAHLQKLSSTMWPLSDYVLMQVCLSMTHTPRRVNKKLWPNMSFAAHMPLACWEIRVCIWFIGMWFQMLRCTCQTFHPDHVYKCDYVDLINTINWWTATIGPGWCLKSLSLKSIYQ